MQVTSCQHSRSDYCSYYYYHWRTYQAACHHISSHDSSIIEMLSSAVVLVENIVTINISLRLLVIRYIYRLLVRNIFGHHITIQFNNCTLFRNSVFWKWSMSENLHYVIATQSLANIYNYELSSFQILIDAKATDNLSSYDTLFLEEGRLFNRVIVMSSPRIMIIILVLIFWSRR